MYEIYPQRYIVVTRSISHIDKLDVLCILLWKQTYSAFLILNCSQFYAASHTHFPLLSSALFFLLSLFISPDVWNVCSHIKCVCKSQSNQISLIPGGLSKVVFVCGAFCLCAYTILALCKAEYCNAAVSLVYDQLGCIHHFAVSGVVCLFVCGSPISHLHTKSVCLIVSLLCKDMGGWQNIKNLRSMLCQLLSPPGIR